jgi:hypothetical protein
MADERMIQYFTLEEANRTLPYVGPIVQDIVRAYQEWRKGMRELELLSAQSSGDAGELEQQQSLRVAVDEVAQRIHRYLDELSAVGCVFKGFDDGLVDFLSKLDGRDVYLCWKLGEAEVEYWHELNAGFAGRRELVPELVEGEAE